MVSTPFFLIRHLEFETPGCLVTLLGSTLQPNVGHPGANKNLINSNVGTGHYLQNLKK